jgi:glycosyltransferase involved in cell wall biosynthesis
VPEVTIVMSTFNRKRLLVEALSTALSQEDVDLEVIVVDNGTNDGTSDLLRGLDDPRLRVVRNDVSLGSTGGRNSGLRLAEGRWVTILDDDDLWAPRKVRSQIDAMEREGRRWAYTGCVFIDERRRVLGGRPPLGAEEALRQLPCRFVIPGGMSNMIWDRELFDGDDVLDPTLTFMSDWDLALRLARTGAPAAVAQPFIGYRQHRGALSNRVPPFAAELDAIEAKHADLLDGRRIDRGAQYRFAAATSLRSGQRGLAARTYLRGMLAGDPGSWLRAPGVVLPRALQDRARARFLSVSSWTAEAQTWLSAVPQR